MLLRFALVPALVLSGLLGCAGISVESVPENVTGTWKTRSPAPYIIEHSVHKPQGSAVDHDHIELLERTPQLVHIERPRSPLWIAAQHGNAELVSALVQYGADLHCIGWDGCSCCLR